MKGQRLTQGWKEFVEAHALRVGDFVVFRLERDMLFNVTALGSSYCEIRYTPSGSRRQEEEEESVGTGIKLNHRFNVLYIHVQLRLSILETFHFLIQKKKLRRI